MSAVCPYREAALGGIELQLQRPTLEFDAVLVAEHGYQDFVVQVAPLRIPIDIEPAGVRGVCSPFEHVEPQWVVRSAHPHVIGHEVENLLERVPLKRLAHALEC